MLAEAIDVSNYSDQLVPWHKGLRHAIVQAIDPPAGYPPGQTRDQVKACLEAGLTVDAYLWLWFDLGVDDIERKLALLDGLELRTLWLDVEDAAAKRFDQVATEGIVRRALAACDAYPTWLHRLTGIYTGRWYWQSPLYIADSTFCVERPLWDANYDGIADAAVGFVPYGGWASCAIKQYAGTSNVNGIHNVDRDVLSDLEVTTLSQ